MASQTQAINVSAGNPTPAISWAGGEGHLDVHGVFSKDDIVRIQYSRDSGTSWADVEDPRSDTGLWQTARPRGFGFKLPACDIQALVVRGSPNLTLAVDTV